MLNQFAIFLIILGIILTSIGGILDITNKNTIKISKNHFWNDGIYVTLLAIALLLISKKNI